MANYLTIQAAIDAGIANMTVLRNHSRNDDGTTTYATGIDWFKFNNIVVSNLYSSGNSWVGLGSNSEQLKVNRRDSAVWDEYKETGVIGTARFFKFTWKGTSSFSASYENVDSYQQYFDIFLFDTGQILLRFFRVPTSECNGTNALVCGSETISYNVTAGVSVEYTFTPSDAETGTGWSVSTERPAVVNYKSSGNAVFTLSNYVAGGNDSVFWTANIPIGTDVQVYTKVNDGGWNRVIISGGLIVGLPSVPCTLQIKVELTTSNITKTPTLTQVIVRSNADKKVLVLTSAIPNFSSVIGDLGVIYDGLGGLQGYGGPTPEFIGTFTPVGLTWWGNQNEQEHLEIDIDPSITLTKITYHGAQGGAEHISVNISAGVTLTDIHDI